MRKRKGARAYRVTLIDETAFVFVAPVRNKTEALALLRARFGERLSVVRVHPFFDPWPQTSKGGTASRNANGHTT
jgi:hypothetical protein